MFFAAATLLLLAAGSSLLVSNRFAVAARPIIVCEPGMGNITRGGITLAPVPPEALGVRSNPGYWYVAPELFEKDSRESLVYSWNVVPQGLEIVQGVPVAQLIEVSCYIQVLEPGYGTEHGRWAFIEKSSPRYPQILAWIKKKDPVLRPIPDAIFAPGLTAHRLPIVSGTVALAFRAVSVLLVAIALFLALIPAILVGRSRLWRRARRCFHCGYAREGLPEDALCPECGRIAR